MKQWIEVSTTIMKVVAEMEITNTLKSRLVLGKDLQFGNLVIKQTTVDKILDTIGEETFAMYLQPFMLTVDNMGLPEELTKGSKVLDLLFCIDGWHKTQGSYNEETSMIQIINSALHFFLDTDDIILYEEHMRFLVNHSLYIDRNNFDDLADLILLMCKVKKAENEKEKLDKTLEGKSEDFKKRYMRHLNNRKQYQEKHKNDSGLFKIINYLANEGNINYDIGNLTYWQLINSYENKLNKEVYQRNLQMLTVASEEFAKKLDLKHWSEKLKIELDGKQ